MPPQLVRARTPAKPKVRVPVEPRTRVLAWRKRWLLSSLPARVRPLARHVALLFHASFAIPGLKENAPGIVGYSRTRGLANLAQRMDLPPPSGGSRGNQRIAAVFGTCSGTRTQPGLTLWVLPQAGLGLDERTYVQERIRGIEAWIQHHRLPAQVKLVTPSISMNAEPWPEIATYGALLAGRPPSHFWGSAPTGVSVPLKGQVRTQWLDSAPTPLSQLLAVLLFNHATQGPGSALGRALQAGVPERALANPEAFLARWAMADVPDCTGPLGALFLPRAEPRSVKEILDHGRALAMLAVRKVRRWPASDRKKGTQILRDAVIGTEVPAALLPTLAVALDTQQVQHGKHKWTLTERKVGKTRELRDSSGGRMGRGLTASQARARALALLALALGRSPLPSSRGFSWQRIGERLAAPVTRRTMLVLVHAERIKGELGVGLSRGVLVLLRPGHRPSSVRLPAAKLLGTLLREQLRGSSLEILPASPEAGPQVRRFQHLTNRMADAGRLSLPLAVEDGRSIWFADATRVRRFSRARFALRPRRCLFVAEGPETSTVGRPWPSLIQCHAMVLSPGKAWVRYEDANHWQLTEQVSLAHLESHLAETVQLLRSGNQPWWLAVRAAEDLELAIRRHGAARGPVAHIKGVVKLPLNLSIQLPQQQVKLTPSAAAEELLSAWSQEEARQARIATDSLEGLSAEQLSTTGLLKLYARSVLVRRLWARMHHRLAH